MNNASTAMNRPTPQVSATSGKVPQSVRRLLDLMYLERALHRIMCGWANQFEAWADKVRGIHHVWQQAEIVQKMRDRIDQFPGVNPDQPVSHRLQDIAEAVLDAPSFEDAIDGMYQILNTALAEAYLEFLQSVHPVHDAPSHEIIANLITTKDLQRKWRSEYRQRIAHTTDADYAAKIRAALEAANHLHEPLGLEDKPAELVGVASNWRPYTANIPQDWLTTPENNIRPYIDMDFADHVEARRLFWPIGYMRELGLAIDQLIWLYDGHFMPWQWQYEISRHMWDESRHGDSGYHRLADFGIDVPTVGFTHEPLEKAKEKYPQPVQKLEAMTPDRLYESVYFIGMVAETGHFRVKREAYADFRDGGDLESAEMMLFDIIDETMHVQYAHDWLDVLAEKAGVDNTNYEKRAATERAELQKKLQDQIARDRESLPRDPQQSPAYATYLQLLQIMRKQSPLNNVDNAPQRSPLPV